MLKMSTEYLVVGSGAGGGTVARELALRGGQVTVLERGRDLSRVGNHLFAAAVLDHHGFLTSEEGMGVARALVTGGSTVITCGTSARPPDGVFEKHGIDLEPFLVEAEKDLRVTTLPDEMMKARPTMLPRWPAFPRAMGIMTKGKDELAGRINADGTFSKRLTHKDRAVLDKGISISRKMLVEAGCPSDTIWVTRARGAHPGGTCRIGEVVDADLATGIRNLYVCDASVIPDSPAAPVVLTLVALGKRLAEELRPEA